MVKRNTLSTLLPASRWEAATTPEDQRLEWMLAKNALWAAERIEDEVEQAYKNYLVQIDLPASDPRLSKVSMSVKMTGAMLAHGYEFDEAKTYFTDQLSLALSTPVVIKAKESVKKKTTSNDDETPCFSFIEQLADARLETPVPNFGLVIERLNPPPAEIKSMIAHYTAVLGEITAALHGGDEDLKEGYSHLRRDQLEASVEWYQELLGALTGAKPKREMKPRKAKPVTPEKATKLLKPMREDTELGLKSLKPDSVVGAKSVVCFNTKTRMLHYYVAKGEALGVYRASICDFDESKSFKKKLRKPKEQLAKLLQGTRLFFEREVQNIRSKPSETVGRVSKTTMILRVFNK